MKLDNTWKSFLKDELNKNYFTDLMTYIAKEQKTQIIYPADENIFNAFSLTPFDKVKVVIIGQDPYHGEGQSHGLAFSVQDSVPFPPSLRNIFTEYCSDLGFNIPTSGNLTSWAMQGVLLLNTVLTVRANVAHSHKNQGWELFIDAVIKKISDEKEHVVFILWGKPAQMKVKLIDERKHLVLKSPHPSPLSSYRGFFGSKPFSKVNNYLDEHGITKINWKLV